MKFCKFLDVDQLILHVLDKLKNLPQITIKITQTNFIATHTDAKKNSLTVEAKETTKISNSEVVIESIEVREISRFYVITLKLEQTFAAAVKTFEINVCQMSELSMFNKLFTGAH